MPRKNIEPMSFDVPVGKAEEIRRHATESGVELSEYLRRLIEADFKAAGKDIDLTVMKRGQYKREKGAENLMPSIEYLRLALCAATNARPSASCCGRLNFSSSLAWGSVLTAAQTMIPRAT